MKKIYAFLAALCMLGFSTVDAQSQRNCGSTLHHQQLLQSDPDYSARRAFIENETAKFISNNSNRSSAVITIPVVVHVVYNTTAQNISDAQILSQIAVLNEDFRKLNADISNVPSAFQNATADCQIQFCLAQRDPQGNATTGIIRKQTSVTSFNTNDNIKRTINGGSDAWPRDSYLNIWTGNLSGGLLGYAQFPGGPASTDGVVCAYDAFGRVGTLSPPFNKGRTATHEVGHWLNLYHIWGDDGSSCSGSDNVTDTPNQGSENYGCPSFPRTDACSPSSPGVMYMNYMDYTDDACMMMFTNGQSARMNAALNGTRSALLNSLGCVPPGGGVCNVPANVDAGSITENSAIINWSSVSGAVDYRIQYRVSGTTTWTVKVSTVNNKKLNSLTPATTYEYRVKTKCASGMSAFSNIQSFTTNPASCPDIYEPNNSRNSATTISLNTNIFGRINSATDKDFFKITTVAGSTNLQIILDQLPADYDIDLLNANGGILASSSNGGTSSELITRNTATANTYYIRIFGFNGAFNKTNCYRLQANASGSPFRSGSEDGIQIEHVNGIESLNLFPNPATNLLNMEFFTISNSQVTAEVIDILGKVVITHNFNAEEGFNSGMVNVQNLNSGIYFMKLRQDGQETISKFMIKK